MSQSHLLLVDAISRGATPSPAPSSADTVVDLRRDGRIDFFRGIALLFIFVDHIPANPLSRFTMRNFGLSDAAEVFVLLAGVSAALAYGTGHSCWRLHKRVLTLYAANYCLIVAAAAVVLATVALSSNAELARHQLFVQFYEKPAAGLIRTALLSFQPEYLDILPMYIVLLLWFPAILSLARKSWAITMAMSISIWLLANIFQLNFSGDRDGGWYFNPFAWQLIFTIGVLIGLNGQMLGAGGVPRSRALLLISLSYLLFAFICMAPWAHFPFGTWRQVRILPADLLGEVSKTYASAWRCLHIMCLVYVASYLLPAGGKWLNRTWARAFVHLGRRSLNVFIVASLFSVVGITLPALLKI